MEERDAGIQARVVPGLCHSPEELAPPAGDSSRRIVLGLCSSDYPELEMHSRARKAGIDPLGMEVVDLGTLCTPVMVGEQGMEKARLLLLAAVARARAYPGSSPAGLKAYLSPFSQRMSRRALLTIPPVLYQAVASIINEGCVAEEGCTLCAQACPRGAIQGAGRGLQVVRSLCDPCGLCVAACPRGAVQLPGSSPAQLDAEVNALLGKDHVSLAERCIFFACRRGIQAFGNAGGKELAASPHWLPVQVPCVGMVSVGCILECLARGASAVGLLPCSGDCPFGQREAWEGKVAYCRELLRLLGESPERVRLLGPEGGERDLDAGIVPLSGRYARGRREHQRSGGLIGPEVAARALLQMAGEYDAPPELSMEHPHSPLGVLQLRPDGCTGCGVCASSCPTGALALERGVESLSLSFDAVLCSGCGGCVSKCPESPMEVIQVRRVTDLARLAQGRVELLRDEVVRCSGCGAPIAPRAMMERVERMLGRGHAPGPSIPLRYCASCQVTSTFDRSS